MCTCIIFFGYFFSCGHHKLSNLHNWFKKRTKGSMSVRTETTTRQACTFKQTFDAILYLNKCTCAPIFNFSPKCPTGGSTKRGISNRIFLAIFVAIFYSFWCTLWHQLQIVDSFLPVWHCLSSVMHLFSSSECVSSQNDSRKQIFEMNTLVTNCLMGSTTATCESKQKKTNFKTFEKPDSKDTDYIDPFRRITTTQ